MEAEIKNRVALGRFQVASRSYSEQSRLKKIGSSDSAESNPFNTMPLSMAVVTLVSRIISVFPCIANRAYV